MVLPSLRHPDLALNCVLCVQVLDNRTNALSLFPPNRPPSVAEARALMTGIKGEGRRLSDGNSHSSYEITPITETASAFTLDRYKEGCDGDSPGVP